MRSVFDVDAQKFVKVTTSSPHISYESGSKCRVRDERQRSLSKRATHRVCEIDDWILWRLQDRYHWSLVTHDRGLSRSSQRTRPPALPKEVRRVLPHVTITLLRWSGHRWNEVAPSPSS